LIASMSRFLVRFHSMNQQSPSFEKPEAVQEIANAIGLTFREWRRFAEVVEPVFPTCLSLVKATNATPSSAVRFIVKIPGNSPSAKGHSNFGTLHQVAKRCANAHRVRLAMNMSDFVAMKGDSQRFEIERTRPVTFQ